MPEARILVAAAAVLLAGGLSACGSHASSNSTSKAHFCRSFDTLTSRTTPRQAADRFGQVGTPGDMDSSARHGLEVLVDHLRQLPDQTKPADVTSMVRNLHAQDAEDVRAFIAYYARECRNFSANAGS